MDPLELTFTVNASTEHAFDLWATKIDLWWPRAHTVSREPGLSVTFEPRSGGRIYERTPSGEEHDWGEVVEWEPPNRLVYLWHLMFDRRDATEVEVTFTPEGGKTSVTIEHRGWERLGAEGATRRDRTHHGWGAIVPSYQEAAARRI